MKLISLSKQLPVHYALNSKDHHITKLYIIS